MYDTETEIFRYRLVERHVLERLETGAFTPGQKLPSLRRLGARLGVGLATVQHAYTELERKGVIEARPRSGFFVRQGLGLPAPPAHRPEAPSSPQVIARGKLIGTVLESVGDRALLPLGVVCPDERLMPVKALARIMAAILRSRPGRAAGYEAVPGNAELRRRIAFRHMEQGVTCRPEDVIVTCGAMEALSIALRCLTRPGDNVLIQSPTYYCFLQLLETLGLRAIEVSSDPERGIDPADVAAALERFAIRAAIFSPNFNNPDGSLMPEAAKAEIAALLAEREVPLVEDDVSGELHFAGPRPGTFKAHDRKGLVLHCSSFSKTLTPGFRVGWMLPGRFLEKALEVKATTNVCCATPTQLALAEYLAGGQYERHLTRLRAALAGTMEAMRQHVHAWFPEGTRVTRPRGGLVLWVELPGDADGVALFFKAREEGIGIAPGRIFTPQDHCNNFIRLSCGLPWDERLAGGLRRLGELAGELSGATAG